MSSTAAVVTGSAVLSVLETKVFLFYFRIESTTRLYATQPYVLEVRQAIRDCSHEADSSSDSPHLVHSASDKHTLCLMYIN